MSPNVKPENVLGRTEPKPRFRFRSVFFAPACNCGAIGTPQAPLAVVSIELPELQERPHVALYSALFIFELYVSPSPYPHCLGVQTPVFHIRGSAVSFLCNGVCVQSSKGSECYGKRLPNKYNSIALSHCYTRPGKPVRRHESKVLVTTVFLYYSALHFAFWARSGGIRDMRSPVPYN